MDEEFYYYMDGRNARRPAQPTPVARQVIVAPPGGQLAAPMPQPAAMAPPQQALPPQPMPMPMAQPMPPPYAMGYPAPPFAPSPFRFTPPPYVPPYGMPPMYYGEAPSVLQAMFGKVSLGQVVDLGAQIYAAAQKLPTAPVATANVTDNFANLITYQSALASHAKRDEQVRTIGALIGKLVG